MLSLSLSLSLSQSLVFFLCVLFVFVFGFFFISSRFFTSLLFVEFVKSVVVFHVRTEYVKEKGL